MRLHKAIEAEAVAQKAIDIARQDQEKAKIENDTAVLKEKAEAEKKTIAAQAEADANKMISASVTDELTKYLESQARLKHGWVEVMTNQAIVDTNK